MDKGLLIVIDGIDGAGKTTQVELLKQSLASQGRIWEAISFPRYEDNLYGKLIKRYLEGEFGNINEVNPYLMAPIFAGDRILAKPLIEVWLSTGKLVIANRYVSASKAHLGAHLEVFDPEAQTRRGEKMRLHLRGVHYQRENFMRWLDKLEYETNGLPKPDLTILLDVDPKVGQHNVQDKNVKDIHEDSIKHLEEAAKIYLELAQAEPNWQVVNCMISDKMRSKEDIHKEITALIDRLV
ncbi:hypothetical protein HYW41_03265 [Candidatus Daviesbacteria bacterium]|nr:hypothetical protein [Candidatus Daviesbacteria bacterium]